MGSSEDVSERLKAALADRYRIEREIGSGGMATVYVAEDLKHQRQVAVKVLRPELAAVIGAERFLHEINVTANLQHPHLLPLFDSGQADSFLYYVMPFVEGESLRSKLDRERQLSIDDAVQITEQVASALDYAHRNDVIHRDIKPENILLHEGQALVADFGIALAVQAAGGDRLTETGLSLGTPQYMSPEQATADRELDGRSDVYSLACVLYEMLAGEAPHTGPTVQAIMAKVITDRPRNIRSLRDTVPLHLEASLDRALAKLPADRFDTAAHFAEALTNPGALAALAVSAERPGAAPQVSGFAVKPRWLRWAIPVSLVSLVGLAIWLWLHPARSPGGGPMRFEIPIPPSEPLADFPGNVIALSPDGTHIVYVAEGDQGPQLFLRPLNQLEARPIPGTQGAATPFFSPDGLWIGFITTSDEVSKVPVGIGPVTTLAKHADTRGATWGEDDMIVFASTSGLWRVSANGGDKEQLVGLDAVPGQHRRPESLPGGRGVLFAVGEGYPNPWRIAVYSSATGEVTPLFEGNTPRYSETGHLFYGRADGVLMAVPFDPVRLEEKGQHVALLGDVMVKPQSTTEFDISRKGSLLYLTSTPSPGEMVLVDRTGIEEPLGVRSGILFSPRFSPDGSRLAYTIGEAAAGQVWIHEIAQGTSTPLTLEERGSYPVWSRDGERVAFARHILGTTDLYLGTTDLYWRQADGSGVAEALLEMPAGQRPACFSDDGGYLVYRENPLGETQDIWVLPLEGDRQPWAFIETPTQRETAPALSPGGRWLAYGSNLSGSDEIYVSDFPEPGGRRPVSVDGGTEPVWSPQGNELFYRNGSALMVAAVETTPDFRVLNRQVLFEGPYTHRVYHSNYDIHPDGQRFVMIKPAEAQPPRMVVVLNWLDEVWEQLEAGRRN
jgi:serine/threonine-protein kinase